MVEESHAEKPQQSESSATQEVLSQATKVILTIYLLRK